MRGLLRLTDDSGEREIELTRGRTTVGGSPIDTLKINGEGYPASMLTLQWEPRRATWMLRCLRGMAPAVTVSGRPVAPDAAVQLASEDCIVVGTAKLQFDRVLAPVSHAGQPVTRLPLDQNTITIGREDPGRSHDASRLDLDPEEITISRNHAMIEKVGAEYFLVDLSRSGTELNGSAFTRERLVFGDRFRISGYIFEFTGDALQLFDPEASGSISAQQLRVVAGERTILDDVSLNVTAGEFIGVLGGSGQGKSTLLNALCGVNPATSGDVLIGGVSIQDREKLRAIGVGFVPQDDIVHRELTVREAITFSARLRLNLEPTEIDALVARVTNRLGLSDHVDKRIADLSGGQRKRVSIAIELLAKPSVLFLDEPSSGLDPATEEALMTLLQSLTLTKLTIVTTTHVLQKAYLFDRIVFIQGGRLVFAGGTDEARQHFLLHEDNTAESLDHSPIERIYSILAHDEKSAAQWEKEYKESRFASRAVPPLRADRHPLPSDDRAERLRVSPVTQLWLLGWRQWSILQSDRMNLGFLLLQPMLIGFLVAWVADKWALRMFLCVVATMWFGCSNGAQQIVAELSIFRRERVSGQGLNTYILSKLGFLSLLSAIQALLLFGLIVTLSPVFHSDNIDKANMRKEFALRLEDPRTLDAAAMGDDFEARDADSPSASATPTPASRSAKAPPRPVSAIKRWALFSLADFFQVSQNVIDSGRRMMTSADGSIRRDAQGKPLSVPAMPLTQVFLVTIGIRFLAVTIAALIGVGIGLAISSVVSNTTQAANTTQAVLWVPLTLIPQILLGGVVVTVPDMHSSVRAFSSVVPSFVVQRMMDVSGVFGLATPFLTNRTKTPVFLTSRGEKETVEWKEGDRSYSQSYDKISPVNIAWQNLAVKPESLGQHKQASQPLGEGFRVEYRDTVESRHDVRLSKGTVVRSLSVFYKSVLIAIMWVGVCYGVIFMGLRQKQTGK